MDDETQDNVILGSASARTESKGSGLAERYQLLIELSPNAIAVHQEGRIVYANAAALEFARVKSSDEMIGRMIVDFVHPDSVQAMVERILSMGTRPGAATEPEEVVMVDSLGDPRPMIVTSVRTVWSGSPAYQVILQDISAEKLAETAESQRVAIADHVSNAVVSVDRDMRIQSWNPAAEQMFGIVAEDAIGHTWTEVTSPDVDPTSAAEVGDDLTAVHRRVDSGRRFLAKSSFTSTADGYLIVARRAGRPLIERLESILAALHQAVLVIDAEGAIELANPAARALFGSSGDAALGVPVSTLPLEFTDGDSPVTECLATGASSTDRTAVLSDSAGDRWLSCSCRALDPELPDSSVLLSIVDITEAHRRVTRLDWEAHHDNLTGLLNRAGIVRQIHSVFAARSESAPEVLVCRINIDDFSAVTEMLGYPVSDTILKIVANRMTEVLPLDAELARVGDGSFVLVARVLSQQPEVAELAAAIHDTVLQPILINGQRISQVTVSLGVAIGAAGSRTPGELLSDAAIAARNAKQEARVSFVEFRPEHREFLERRRELEQELRLTLNAYPHRLRVVYQPIVKLKTMHVVALEALVRWDHPVSGIISPDQFIPIAEETDLIDLVGAHVLATAVRDFAAQPWASEMILTVNVSRHQLTDCALPKLIAEVLAETGLPPWRLCLEITESSFADVSAALVRIRELGVRIALDDFGTGASSLSQLHLLPIDIVKADRQFADALGKRKSALVTLAAIASIADACDMEVVVEGVETDAQEKMVARSGACFAQGFHYGHPMSLAEIEQIISVTAPVSADPVGGRVFVR